MDIAGLLALFLELLGPLAVAMVREHLSGGDPLDVLERERVESILPAGWRLRLAMLKRGLDV